MSDSFKIRQNDRKEPLARTLQDSLGAAVDLTGATVKFLMRKKREATAPLKVNVAAVVVAAASGQVRYDWAAGDTDTVGTYKAEFEVTFADGRKQSFPNSGYLLVLVTQELG